mgnify:CR=1 FL=1
MISNPKHGWCDFKIEDDNNNIFFGTPSYITNVPVDLLQAFLDYKTNGQGMAWFDEEGTEFTLVITPYSIFIIEEKDKPILHDFSEVNVETLEKELIEDIESDLAEWSMFYCDYDEEEAIKANREHIKNLICQLKEYV